MKKVLAAMSGIIFSVFCIAILGLLMSFTLGALKKLFPDSFVNQMWGLVLFDIAAMVWGLAFVFKSESVGQYAAGGIGFVTGFLGTLLMVTFEVMTSGQTFVTDNGSLGRWAVYGFVIVTAIHAALVYLHHGTAPDIHQKINVGIARGEITTEAIRQATESLEVQKAQLAESIHSSIVDQVKRDLNIPIAVDPSVGFVPAVSSVPYPVQQPKKKGMFDWLKKPANNAPMVKNEQVVVDVPKLQEQPAPKQEEPPAANDASFPG
jgi:hypothetical protein